MTLLLRPLPDSLLGPMVLLGGSKGVVLPFRRPLPGIGLPPIPLFVQGFLVCLTCRLRLRWHLRSSVALGPNQQGPAHPLLVLFLPKPRFRLWGLVLTHLHGFLLVVLLRLDRLILIHDLHHL